MLIIKSIIAIITALTAFISSYTAVGEAVPFDEINGGDPFIAEYEGDYYYTFTTGGGIDIFNTDSIEKINVTDRKTVFWCGENGTVGDIWAPEIHKIGDRWYIIASAMFDSNVVDRGLMPHAKEYDGNNDYYRYGFVLESKTEDVFGEYVFKSILTPGGLNNIDGTYLQKDGKLYYVFSGYNNVANQSIYIAEMVNPYTFKEENGKVNTTELSSPILPWERQGWYVNEAPAVLYNGEDIYIVYSASGFSSGSYCMGMLTLKGKDVMKCYSWEKSLLPVVYHQPDRGIYNLGHCSFLYEDDEIYMVYHANRTKDFFESPRLSYVEKIEFKNGRPVF